MEPYHVTFSPAARAQFDQMRARAANAGKLQEFRACVLEMARAISDRYQALHVGSHLRATNLPGGFERQYQHLFVYMIYVIYPDEGRGFVTHVEFDPPSWA